MTFTSGQRRTLAWLAIAASAVLLLWLLSPFIISAVLTYALRPAVDGLARYGLPRVLAVALVEIGTFAAMLLLPVLLLLLLVPVPVLAKELPQLREQIPLLAERLNRSVAPWLAQGGFHVALDTEGIKALALKYLNSNFEDWLATALNSARIGGSIAMAVVGTAVLVPVVTSYLLMGWVRLVAHVELLVLNPLMVIFALLAFGHLFGFVGVLIALPVSAVGVVAVRRLRGMYLGSRLYAG